MTGLALIAVLKTLTVLGSAESYAEESAPLELGEKEYEMNREFGEAMADCCDVAILVGKKRSQAIGEGLRAGGFAEERIYVVSSLDEATGLLREIVKAGDTVLFENDLPDNYSE